ncbi:MAG: UvrD-helicase domain-containing protein [Bacteroidota bacterium]
MGINDIKRFHIYKSSAGSGKTTALIGDYLQLSLSSSNPSTFKSILAITFTNKAADELKERFLFTLKLIKDLDLETSKDLQLFEVTQLLDELKISPKELKARAERVLDLALRDYDDIGISTIDSFNHKLITSFSRDLRIQSDFEVELEEANFFADTVDLLLQRVGHDDHITNHLLGYLKQSMEDDKKANISKKLTDLRQLITSEEAIRPIESLKEIEPDQFGKTKKSVHTFSSNFEKETKRIGRAAISIFAEVNATADDLKQKSTGYWIYFKRLSEFNGDYRPLHSRLIPQVEEPWYGNSASTEVKNALDSRHQQLLSLYRLAEKHFKENYNNYKLAKSLLSQIDLLAVLSDLSYEMKELAKERNVVLISDFNRIISQSMRDEPVAFVYEKFGNRYKHILIDEFQDTSELQWKNITPFIVDSLASGQYNMVVGDAKQSIYRWRGGKAEQLIRLPELDPKDETVSNFDRKSFADNSNIIPLDTNYRSLPIIVEFNNQLIGQLKELFTSSESIFRKEYAGSSAKQKVPSDKAGGYVKWQQLEKNAKPEIVSNQVLSAINESIGDGYAYGDMAILVRKKGREVNDIINTLTQAGIPFTTRDSFGLDMSPTVLMLLEFLRLSYQPDEAISQIKAMREICRLREVHFQPGNFWKWENREGRIEFQRFLTTISDKFSMHELKRMSALEICYEVLEAFVPEEIQKDVFVQSFLNTVLERGNSSSAAEIVQWWDNLNEKPEAKVGDSENQVKIMTIHKSKGLQFPVVILPNLNWRLGNPNETKWIATKNNLDIPFSYVPLTTGKSLSEMGFSEQFESLQEEMHFDNLNLIYVALTRPSQRLYINHSIGTSSQTGESINQIYEGILNGLIQDFSLPFTEGKALCEGVLGSISFG